MKSTYKVGKINIFVHTLIVVIHVKVLVLVTSIAGRDHNCYIVVELLVRGALWTTVPLKLVILEKTLVLILVCTIVSRDHNC